jgi:hypothetical protein
LEITNCYTGGEAPAYHLSPVKALVLFLALVFAVPAAAQPDRRRGDARPQRHMKDEERQRMREDVRDAYRERQGRPERPRQMSPQERDKLRQDIEEANRSLRRRK